MKRLLVLAAALATLAGCGGSGDQSAQIEADIGAVPSACTQTPYELISRLDNSKTRIYDCFLNGKELCVTEENGIAHDVTAEARLLFQAALSGGAPTCAAP